MLVRTINFENISVRLKNQEPRGKPTRYELENTFKKLRGKPRELNPLEGLIFYRIYFDFSFERLKCQISHFGKLSTGLSISY